ncbi:lipid-A-disaccharide synthase [Desulfobulbus propionicus DSM 2032]|uniref:Lipid-A-disaccharide synthase n=1 Tax=Desulfobulbus propionicus (strain ATCC 33891 / DSM 2032 / VKM B-1956 / 1pr3) TaxID=577650 RepID=A0A7U3YLS0_DESPD|nr:lipid-A-disaccharide synthase [Desulfobulbus propionicus]ADW17729.1 lipid-A-disaccharide synthase [Desulfobulbus propionicus DSM 2032]
MNIHGGYTQEVMIVAGEASGDLHGANLVRAMREQRPELRFCGMGGRELHAAGVELLCDAAKLAVVGAFEVLSHLGDILAARRALIERMRDRRPGLLILIDYPDFNLLLARSAKKLGIPVFYYISPQVWAWRKGRVRTIKRLTDRMAVILPFEQSFYARYGVRVDFVGHPLMDAVHPDLSPAQFRAAHRIEPTRKLVGLLPGSRRKEVAALLPDFLAAAELLARDHPQAYTFLIPLAPTIGRTLLDEHGLAAWLGRYDYRVISEGRYAMMAACDAVVAASGTVLLELALLGVPTVATYRVSPRTYFLGRLLIRNLRFFSLVNLIGEREIIPELLQDAVTPGRIASELRNMLDNDVARQSMLAGLREVRERLGGPGASRRAADIALQVLADRQRPSLMASDA